MIDIEVILLFQTVVLLVIGNRAWHILKTLRAIAEQLKEEARRQETSPTVRLPPIPLPTT
jgi:hypothetical protein